MSRITEILDRMGIKQIDEKKARLLLGLGLTGIILIGLSSYLAGGQGNTGGGGQGPRTMPVAADAQTGDAAADPMVVGDLESVTRYAREMEVRAQRILTKIAGAGRVWVTISMEQGTITEYATNNTTEKRVTTEKDSGGTLKSTTESTITEQVVAMNEGGTGEAPVLVKRSVPTIAGVLVVSEGAVDPGVKLELTQAVATLFGIPEHRILVAGTAE